MEEIWNCFCLSKEEKGVIEIKSHEMALSKKHAQVSILFKLQTNKEFNKEAFKSTIYQLWHYSHSLTIKEVSANLFLAIFVTKKKKKKKGNT